MGQEAGDHHDQQDLSDVVGILCPECGEYWEALEPRWAECPMCYYEFEVDDETGDNDDFVSSESDPFESQEFAPLIDTAGPLIYRNNGFRITGLPVTASERKVKDFEKLAKVGRAASLHRGPLPITVDENALQSAVERLKDSDLRLVDEFFWFWPPEWNQPIEDDLLAALAEGKIDSAADILIGHERWYQQKKVATHNLAVLFHAAALDLEFESESRRLSDEEMEKRDAYWRQAFSYWEAVISNKNFWEHFSSRIAQLEDPRFSAGQIKGSLPLALTMIVAKLALRSAEKGDFPQASRYLLYISCSSFNQRIISRAMVPVARRLRERIKASRDDAKNKVYRDPAQADRIVGDLLASSMPLINIMRDLPGENTPASAQLLEDACDEVASFVNEKLASFANRTNQWDVCTYYLEKALSIAVNPILREQITESLNTARNIAETIRQNAERRRIESRLSRLRGEIEGILKSSTPPEVKLKMLNGVVQWHLTPIKQGWGETSEAFTTACNLLAEGVRSFAIEINNISHQYQLALEAISLALSLCRSAEMRERIRINQARIEKNAETARQKAERQRIDTCLDNLSGEIEGILKSPLSPEEKFRELSGIVQPRLTSIGLEWGKNSDTHTAACNLLAAGMRSVAVELDNNARQYRLAVEAANLALKLSRDTKLDQLIRDECSEYKKHADFNEVVRDLKPITSAPALKSVIGIGTTLYGRSGYNVNTNSYLTTLYFIILAIPIFPIARYRVIDLGANSYRFLGKAPLRRSDVFHRFAIVCLVWFSINIHLSFSPGRLTSVAPTPTPAVSSQFSIPELIEYLNSSNARTRKWAAECLAEKGANAQQAIPALRLKLKDKDIQVRTAARAALAKISQNSRTDKEERK